jgi:hypothetical protein
VKPSESLWLRCANSCPRTPWSVSCACFQSCMRGVRARFPHVFFAAFHALPVQKLFYEHLILQSDESFDDVVAMVACVKALSDRNAKAYAANHLLVNLCWSLQVHRRAPLFRPAVAASVSEADDVGTEVAEGAWCLFVCLFVLFVCLLACLLALVLWLAHSSRSHCVEFLCRDCFSVGFVFLVLPFSLIVITF